MQKLISTLASALIPNLAVQGCTLEEVLSGELKHTKLDWQIPPLKATATLNGLPLWCYFQQPFKVDEEVFFSFWSDTLYNMYYHPNKVWLGGCYREAQRELKLPKVMSTYWLSYPEGAPGRPSDYSPIVFSLECAALYTLTGYVIEVVESPDNYYVVTSQGREIGVKDGLPLVASDVWDYSALGTVDELLYQPRGLISNQCEYGVIDKLRCYLHQNKDKFEEFEGMDLALQALRLMVAGEDVLKALRSLRVVKDSLYLHSASLDSSLELLSDWKLSDRQKILTLKETLVPSVMGRGQFSKLVHPYHAEIPPSLKPGKIFQIIEKLKKFAEEQKAKHARKK